MRLVVKDNGPGIPANLKDRIFDPFFSTKDQGGAVGLGLSLSHQIVSNHHGKLTVESEPGLGAAFTVVLPAAAQAPHLD